MEDTQKQDKLPPIKYTKRVGHLFEHVRDIDNLKEAIKDAARHKRKRKEVQKVLEDIDGQRPGSRMPRRRKHPENSHQSWKS